MNRTQKPAVKSSSPLPTSTTTPVTTISETSEPCANVATSNMTNSTMPNQDGIELASSAISDSQPCSTGTLTKKKHPTRRQAMRQMDKPDDLLLMQLTAESYRPAMDSIKRVVAKYGNGAQVPLYTALNKQVAAKAGLSDGINDLNATRRQRLCVATQFEDIYDVHTMACDANLPKDEMKRLRNERLTKTALFFGLGTKKDRKGVRS